MAETFDEFNELHRSKRPNPLERTVGQQPNEFIQKFVSIFIEL